MQKKCENVRMKMQGYYKRHFGFSDSSLENHFDVGIWGCEDERMKCTPVPGFGILCVTLVPALRSLAVKSLQILIKRSKNIKTHT